MAGWTYAEGEAKRKDFMTFWVTDGSTENITKEKLEIIGNGVEDMPISQSATTEERDDVLGNHHFAITNYAKSMTVDPLKVSSQSKYSQKIDELEETQATLDELELTYLCAKRYKTDSNGNMRAWVQKGVVELSDFAPGLEGVSGTHTIHFVGDRIHGSLNPSTMAFTPDGASPASLID